MLTSITSGETSLCDLDRIWHCAALMTSGILLKSVSSTIDHSSLPTCFKLETHLIEIFAKAANLGVCSMRSRTGHLVVISSLEGNCIVEIADSKLDFPDDVSPITAIWGRAT